MSVRVIDTPVLIVGAGPVGLALAADLGGRGIACTIIEQSDGVIYHPRATALNARTMELLRRWGVAEAVKRDGTPPDFPHTALYLTSFDGFEIARIERPSHGGSKPSPISPERPQRCNQLWLDPILRDRATGFKTVRLRYRCRFESLIEEDDRVIATVRDLVAGEARQIERRMREIGRRAVAFHLLGEDERLALLAQFGSLLAGVASDESPVRRLAWYERTRPSGSVELRDHVRDRLEQMPAEQVGRVATEQLLAAVRPFMRRA